MSWPSYDLSLLEKLPIPVIGGVVPGKHTTRKGWLTKDFHYPGQSPYTSDVDAPLWTTQFGEKKTLREIARESAWFFRKSIRRYSDPFSFRLLFAVLEGRAPSMLELVDRPTAYEDVGILAKWGMVIHELKNYEAEMGLLRPRQAAWDKQSIDEHVVDRATARTQHAAEMVSVSEVETPAVTKAGSSKSGSLLDEPRPRAIVPPKRLSRRKSDTPGKLVPPRTTSPYLDRRGTALLPSKPNRDRRKATDRRKKTVHTPSPDRRLTRSAYEQVFLKLVSGSRLKLGNDLYKPVGMKGWYHAIFRRESDGSERLLSIDQLLKKMGDWV